MELNSVKPPNDAPPADAESAESVRGGEVPSPTASDDVDSDDEPIVRKRSVQLLASSIPSASGPTHTGKLNESVPDALSAGEVGLLPSVPSAPATAATSGVVLI